MAEAADSGRVKGRTIIKPIVYGNFAKYMGKKREEDGHTHNWTVYLRPYNNEDMSTYVKKVHFKLHDSYTNQNRVLLKPPYEISETGSHSLNSMISLQISSNFLLFKFKKINTHQGWGEFELTIKLYFVDPNEKPVTIYHALRLFETDPVTKAITIKKYLTSEFYDEIVFHEPTSVMYQLLTNTNQLALNAPKHETNFEDKKEKNLQSILNAQRNVKNEIESVKEKLKLTQEAIEKCKKELAAKNEANASEQ